MTVEPGRHCRLPSGNQACQPLATSHQAAVDAVVGADGEQVEMTGVARDGGDRRTGAAGRGDAALHVEPAGPAAGLVPPVAHRAAVARHGEHVEMLGEARDHA